MGPPTDPGPRAAPKFPHGQSAPAHRSHRCHLKFVCDFFEDFIATCEDFQRFIAIRVLPITLPPPPHSLFL
ncbi:unnamed protein product, partial [Staurois parvus]